MTERFPRETDELLPVTVTLAGTPVTAFQVQVTRNGARPIPGGWSAPVMKDGARHVRVNQGARGEWRVWAKPTTDDEAPHIDCGTFITT